MISILFGLIRGFPMIALALGAFVGFQAYTWALKHNAYQQGSMDRETALQESIQKANDELKKENEAAIRASLALTLSSNDRAERVRICKAEVPYCRPVEF